MVRTFRTRTRPMRASKRLRSEPRGGDTGPCRPRPRPASSGSACEAVGPGGAEASGLNVRDGLHHIREAKASERGTDRYPLPGCRASWHPLFPRWSATAMVGQAAKGQNGTDGSRREECRMRENGRRVNRLNGMAHIAVAIRRPAVINLWRHAGRVPKIIIPGNQNPEPAAAPPYNP